MKTILLNTTPMPVNNIYCIGRSYAEHISELNNVPSDNPVVFLKPTTSLTTANQLTLPKFSNDIHHEVELVLYIGTDIDDHKIPTLDDIAGYAVGLDLTARDIQSQLKAKGHPWTLAKGFKNAAWVSPFVAGVPSVHHLSLAVNGQLRQNDSTDKLLYNFTYQLHYLHAHFGLRAGDLIFTGTPKGVGQLKTGDTLVAGLDDKRFELSVI
ncbi:fumarylacetoacetate hydrolase family protein [Moraxella oblonga]|uniref:fumarylacetoacetate hydrolase family protein n=1 Tax=Moraxella oblonga TaxID=200413 RepID=UPI0008311E8B|nr:fumarylacetoacetate hydrolase family protein [Moraxella oblonga]